MELKVDIMQLVHSLSDTLDLVGIDEVQHGKRVAFMSMSVAKVLGLDEKNLDLLYRAALLHDCGVSSTQVHRKLVTELDWSDSQDHCIRGEALLGRCRFFKDLSTVIRYHHTHWEEMPESVPGDTARLSNLIYLMDRVDALIVQKRGTDLLVTRDNICGTVNNYRGSFFKEDLVDAFLDVAENEFFWLYLDPRHLTRYLSDMERQGRDEIADTKTILEIADIFADIVDTKSAFTLEHSRGVAGLARFLGGLSGLSDDTLDMLETAGLLHDLGKLNVPDEILEKAGPLDAGERAVILRHSFESYQILSRITGFEEIAQWAAFHHEDLTGTGYPFRKKQEGLSREARIIAVADVFQALAQDRPYRKSLPVDEILGIMADMTGKGKLDPGIVDLVRTHQEECWRHAKCLV